MIGEGLGGEPRVSRKTDIEVQHPDVQQPKSSTPEESQEESQEARVGKIRDGIPLPGKPPSEELGEKFVKDLDPEFVNLLKRQNVAKTDKPSKTQEVISKISPFKAENQKNLEKLIEKIASSLLPQTNKKLMGQIKAEILHSTNDSVKEALKKIEEQVVKSTADSPADKKEIHASIILIREKLSAKLQREIKEVEILASPALADIIQDIDMEENAAKYLELLKDKNAGNYIQNHKDEIQAIKYSILDYHQNKTPSQIKNTIIDLADFVSRDNQALSLDLQLLFFTVGQADENKQKAAAEIIESYKKFVVEVEEKYTKASANVDEATLKALHAAKDKEYSSFQAKLQKAPLIQEIIINDQLDQTIERIEKLHLEVSTAVKNKKNYPPSYTSIQELMEKIKSFNKIISNGPEGAIKQLEYRKERIHAFVKSSEALLTRKVMNDAVAKEIEEMELSVRRQINALGSDMREYSRSVSVAARPSLTSNSQQELKYDIRDKATRYLELIADENAIGYVKDPKNAAQVTEFKNFIFNFFYSSRNPDNSDSLNTVYGNLAEFIDRRIGADGDLKQDVMLFFQTTNDPEIRSQLIRIRTERNDKEALYQPILNNPAFKKFILNKEFEQAYNKGMAAYDTLKALMSREEMPSTASIDHLNANLNHCIELLNINMKKETVIKLTHLEIKTQHLRNLARLCDTLIPIVVQNKAINKELDDLAAKIETHLAELQLTKTTKFDINTQKDIKKYYDLLNDPRAKDYMKNHENQIKELRNKIYGMTTKMPGVTKEAQRVFANTGLSDPENSEAYKDIYISLLVSDRFSILLNNHEVFLANPKSILDKHPVITKKLEGLKKDAEEINAKLAQTPKENLDDRLALTIKANQIKKEIAESGTIISRLNELINSEKELSKHTKELVDSLGMIHKEKISAPYAKAREQYLLLKEKIINLESLSDAEIQEFSIALAKCLEISESGTSNNFIADEKEMLDKMKILLAAYQVQAASGQNPQLLNSINNSFLSFTKIEPLTYQNKIDLLPYHEHLNAATGDMSSPENRRNAMEELEDLHKNDEKLWSKSLHSARAKVIMKSITAISISKKNSDSESDFLTVSLPEEIKDGIRVLKVKNSSQEIFTKIEEGKAKTPQLFENGNLPISVVEKIFQRFAQIDKATDKQPFQTTIRQLNGILKNYLNFKQIQFNDLTGKYNSLKGKKDQASFKEMVMLRYQIQSEFESFNKRFEGTPVGNDFNAEFSKSETKAELDKLKGEYEANLAKNPTEKSKLLAKYKADLALINKRTTEFKSKLKTDLDALKESYDMALKKNPSPAEKSVLKAKYLLNKERISRRTEHSIFSNVSTFLNAKGASTEYAFGKIAAEKDDLQYITLVAQYFENPSKDKTLEIYHQGLIQETQAKLSSTIENYSLMLKKFSELPSNSAENQRTNLFHLSNLLDSKEVANLISKYLPDFGEQASNVDYKSDIKFTELYQKLIPSSVASKDKDFIKNATAFFAFIRNKPFLAKIVSSENQLLIKEACDKEIKAKLVKCQKLLLADSKKDFRKTELQAEFALFKEPVIAAYITRGKLYEENKLYQMIKANLDIFNNIQTCIGSLNKKPVDGYGCLVALNYLKSPQAKTALERQFIQPSIVALHTSFNTNPKIKKQIEEIQKDADLAKKIFDNCQNAKDKYEQALSEKVPNNSKVAKALQDFKEAYAFIANNPSIRKKVPEGDKHKLLGILALANKISNKSLKRNRIA